MKFQESSYDPRAEVEKFTKETFAGTPVLRDIATVCSLNNKSKIVYDGTKFNKQGEPTEAALKVAAEKLGKYDSRLANSDYTKDPTPYGHLLGQTISPVATLDFTSERKMMSTVVKGFKAGSNSLLIKGAPERVIAKCETYKNAAGDIIRFTPEGK